MKKRYINSVLKRLLDIIIASFTLIILFPIFILIALIIKIDSRGEVFYCQLRIGKNLIPFQLLKFRTMKIGSDKKGLLTIGNNDLRITRVGYWLRKYKIDELPQFINVLKGEMSIVGPRPEVKRYVELYNDQQREVLSVKPGITDIASISFKNESRLLSQQEDPENYYINTIMPIKLEMNLKYIDRMSIWLDISLIFRTIREILINR